MKKFFRPFLIFLSFVLLTGCAGRASSAGLLSSDGPTLPAEPASPAQSPTPEPEYWPTDGWQTSSPEQEGMDSEILSVMFAAIREEQLNLHSVLVVRNGSLVLEAYYHPYGPADVHTVESNTKSVIGALVGVAIDQGKIESAEQKLLDFFPDLAISAADPRKEAITLHNLLSMTPGLDCEDFSTAAQDMYKTDEWVPYLLNLPMNTAPGEQWVYCSGASHLLSAVLQNSTGMDARTYANQNLFQPLGIPEVSPENWGTDPQGVTNGIAGLYLTPRDLAKLGYLYLHQGQWDGEQVVPQAWMEASTREQAYIGPDEYVGGRDRRFGYLFSIFPDQGMYGYLGRAGQELFVVPEQNLVIVFTASLEVGVEASLLALVNDYIVPAVQSSEPLPADPAAQERLEAYIHEAAGETRPAPPTPDAALEFSGVTYQLYPNQLGWRDMTYIFQPGVDEVILKMSNTPDLAIGLDHRFRLTELPGSRPIGLRGRWETDGRLAVEYVNLGEFARNEILVEFAGDKLNLTVRFLNFPGSPVTLRGTRQP